MTEQHTPTVGVAQIVERDEVNGGKLRKKLAAIAKAGSAS